MKSGALDRQAELESGLRHMKLSLSSAQIEQLLRLVELLAKWNRVYNLSAVRDPQAMVSRHLLDSLAVMPHVHGQRCIDVGTGAGFPGLPLAIALPQVQFTLLDSNGKKTRFIQHAKIELALDNVCVVQNRVQAYQVSEKFDTVIARAFAAVPQLQALTRHLIAPGGLLLAMVAKAPPEAEQDAIEEGFKRKASVKLTVPGTRAERRLNLYTVQDHT